MPALAKILTAISELSNEFEGHISLKNIKGEYFFVNEHMLRAMGRTREQVMGKRDSEIFSPAVARIAENTDTEAYRTNSFLEYENSVMLDGLLREYMAIKCVVKYENGEPFCLCNIACDKKDRQKLEKIRERIMGLFAVT